MILLKKFMHPEYGKAYLWQKDEYMNYELSSIKEFMMGFSGFTMEECEEKIKARGFVEIPL
jgi:hypothetical protein